MDNSTRAEYGQQAINGNSADYEQNIKDGAVRSIVSDTIINILHYARQQGITDLDGLVTSAQINFEEEACATEGCMNDAGDGEGFHPFEPSGKCFYCGLTVAEHQGAKLSR